MQILNPDLVQVGAVSIWAIECSGTTRSSLKFDHKAGKSRRPVCVPGRVRAWGSWQFKPIN
jgi:hypothetical protein